MHLTHVRLLVRDYARCFRFYRDVMELAVTFGDESSGYADFAAGPGATLALFGKNEMAQALGEPAATAATGDRAVLVLQADPLDVVVADLTARGVRFIATPQDRPGWGIRTAHLRDPDGNLIELYEDLPE